MAQQTGGRLFEVKKNQNVTQIYNQIAEELRAQYRLGYTPSQDAAAAGYHQIDLTPPPEGSPHPDPGRLLHRKVAAFNNIVLRHVAFFMHHHL